MVCKEIFKTLDYYNYKTIEDKILRGVVNDFNTVTLLSLDKLIYSFLFYISELLSLFISIFLF